MKRTIDILVCTIDDGLDEVSQVLMPPMDGVHYVVSVQHLADAPPDLPPGWAARADVAVTTLAGRGLSRNRNNALQHATADILVIADDDCRYEPCHVETIRRAYADHPEADAICFEAQSYDGRPMKRYPDRPLPYDRAEREGYFPTSMEITLRRTALQRSGVSFDERFGLGTATFPAGEEDVFITDLQRAGLCVLFIPEVITLTDPATTGDRFLADPRLQATKGAVFRYRHGLLSALWRTLKEGAYHLVHHHVNPLPIWHHMLQGIWKLR